MLLGVKMCNMDSFSSKKILFWRKDLVQKLQSWAKNRFVWLNLPLEEE